MWSQSHWVHSCIPSILCKPNHTTHSFLAVHTQHILQQYHSKVWLEVDSTTGPQSGKSMFSLNSLLGGVCAWRKLCSLPCHSGQAHLASTPADLCWSTGTGPLILSWRTGKLVEVIWFAQYQLNYLKLLYLRIGCFCNNCGTLKDP